MCGPKSAPRSVDRPGRCLGSHSPAGQRGRARGTSHARPTSRAWARVAACLASTNEGLQHGMPHALSDRIATGMVGAVQLTEFVFWRVNRAI